MVDTGLEVKVRAYTEHLSNRTMLPVLELPANDSRPRSCVIPAGAASKGRNRNANVEDPVRNPGREFVPRRWLDRWESEGGAWLPENSKPSKS